MELIQGGKYALGERVGSGGMAEVHRGEIRGAEGFSRPVAIKRVLPGLSADAAFSEMFIREARLASVLSHPNIATIIDFDRDDEDRLFIVMELVEGKDLRSLAKSGRLSPSVATFIVIELLRALDYAHHLERDGKPLRIVHRDVTPHNLLLSWQGAVKLTDFGIARAFAESPLTSTGVVKGKAAYLSPEQARAESIDGRSDLFAAGVILHELLSGERLFGVAQGAPDMVVIRRVLSMDVPKLEGISPELTSVAERLLSRERNERFESAKATLEALFGCPEVDNRGQLDLAAVMRERFPAEAPSVSKPDRPLIPSTKPVGDFTGVRQVNETRHDRPPRQVIPSEPTDADQLMPTETASAQPIAPSASTDPAHPRAPVDPDIRATVRVDVEEQLRKMGLTPDQIPDPVAATVATTAKPLPDAAETKPPAIADLGPPTQPSTPPDLRPGPSQLKWWIAIVALTLIGAWVVVQLVQGPPPKPKQAPSPNAEERAPTPTVAPRVAPPPPAKKIEIKPLDLKRPPPPATKRSRTTEM